MLATHWRPILVPLALAAGACGQSVVLPSALATAPPPSLNGATAFNASVFVLPASRNQLIYDVRDIAPQLAWWSSLQMRMPAKVSQLGPGAFTTNATITLAVAAPAPAAMTGSFASNLVGANSVTVFQGPVALPMRSGAPWPAPWEAPFPFLTPFLYVSALGGSLVVDIGQSGAAGYQTCRHGRRNATSQT